MLTLVALIIVFTKVPANPPKHEISVSPFIAYRRQFKTAFTNPSVFFALLSAFLWMAGLQGMFAYVGVYYKQNFNLNEAQVGLVILAAGLGNVTGSMIGGRLSDKIGKKKVVAFASIVAAAGVIGFSLLIHVVMAAIIVHVIWSTACGFGQSALTALVSELSPEVRGTVLSLNSSAMYIGTMVATAISTALLASGGFATVGSMCGVASLLVWPIIGVLVKDRSAT